MYIIVPVVQKAIRQYDRYVRFTKAKLDAYRGK